MDWQAADDWQGGMPGQDGVPAEDDVPAQDGVPARSADLAEVLAAFGHGGTWERAAPCAALAVALETAAGPSGLNGVGQGGPYAGAETDALVGIARQWAAIESWAAAGLMAALRAMMRDDATGTPLLRRRTDLPGGWDDSLNYEIAAALAMGPQSAGNLANLAWTLGMRLPGIGRLLADGNLTRSKARLIAQVFDPLDEDEAARAEALILGDLEGKTYPQVERLAWRAALAIAPDVAQRRRSAAERRARVTVFREEAGTVGLAGRDLPAAEALAGHANVVARAAVYEASGAFPGQDASRLQAQAYLDLLAGILAADRIAFAATANTNGEPPCEPGPDGAGGGGPEPSGGGSSGDEHDPRDGGGRPAPGTGCAAADDEISDIRDLDDYADFDDDHDDDIPDLETDSGDMDMPGLDGGDDEPGLDGGDGSSPDPGGDGGWDERPDDPAAREAPRPPLAEVTVPLATLQGKAERAGDNRLLGALDPALARQMATAAARSAHSRWEVIIVDKHGYAIGHAIARPARGTKPQTHPPSPALSALPARVNITITETFLQQLSTQTSRPRAGAPPGDWDLTPSKPGTWTLSLPGGRQLTVRFDVVPTHYCDHRFRTDSYQPGDRLRRLVQVRDHECTFPTCSRAAKDSDFEHAIPFHRGGMTDACNAGARSRRCHQVKQRPGWTVTQPKPGWHQWTTPTGRTYIQEPWRYTA